MHSHIQLPGSRPILVVVDDERQIRAVLTRLLRTVGVVHSFPSGEEALEFLRREPVDLVLSDMCMPGMTGAQLLAQISISSPRTERILMSGSCDLEPVIASLENGQIGHFISKPWAAAELMTMVQELATRSHRRRMGYPEERITNPPANIGE